MAACSGLRAVHASCGLRAVHASVRAWGVCVLLQQPLPSSALHVHMPARRRVQVGVGLLQHFGGHAAQLIAAAEQSAVRLAKLVACHFPGFRDQCIYNGRQVSAHHRAAAWQILACVLVMRALPPCKCQRRSSSTNARKYLWQMSGGPSRAPAAAASMTLMR